MTQRKAESHKVNYAEVEEASFLTAYLVIHYKKTGLVYDCDVVYSK